MKAMRELPLRWRWGQPPFVGVFTSVRTYRVEAHCMERLCGGNGFVGGCPKLENTVIAGLTRNLSFEGIPDQVRDDGWGGDDG